MKIDVYDLTSSVALYRYEVGQWGDVPRADAEFDVLSLPDVLIIPQTDGSKNRLPYLQNRECPSLQDILTASGKLDFSGVHILCDFLNGEESQLGLVRDYFSALERYLREKYPSRERADKNIILIPDDYDARYQENLLRCCRLSRSDTALLWRSVALCLGREKAIKEKGCRENDDIAIWDIQQNSQQITLLSMHRDEKQPQYLVPKRSSYKRKERHIHHSELRNRPLFYPRNDFYDVTFHGREGLCAVWNEDKCGFEYIPFERNKRSRNFDAWACHSKLAKTRCIIVSGVKKSECADLLEKVVPASDETAAEGAALFASRDAADLPTYLDECNGLYIIIENRRKETIIAKTLISPNAACRGGKAWKGEPNHDIWIQAGFPHVRFLLVEGDGTGDEDKIAKEPVKELIHDFGQTSPRDDQQLTLYPSMIPGQGIVKVRVKGAPLLKQDIDLDLLLMEPTEETLESLRKKMTHSYPKELPSIRARNPMDFSLQKQLSRYVAGKIHYDHKWFTALKWVINNPDDISDISQLKRENVFGINECPNANFDFQVLFNKLADEYYFYQRLGKSEDEDKLLYLIAMTYQGANPAFTGIVRAVASKLSTMKANEGISRRSFNAFPNLLTQQSDLLLYFNYYVSRAEHRGEQMKERRYDHIEKMTWWNQGLSELLVNHPRMLKDIDSEKCEKCVFYIISILASYYYVWKPDCYVRDAIKCILYMLFRRKYDADFMKDDKPMSLDSKQQILYKKLAQEEWGPFTTLKKYGILTLELYSMDRYYSANIKKIAEAVIKYLNGTGTLGDLPTI